MTRDIRKIYLLFLIFTLMPLLSCVRQGFFSSQVEVKMCGSARVRQVQGETKSVCISPTVFHLPEGEKQTVICRRGLPSNFITPWNARDLAEGKQQSAQEGEGGRESGEESRSNTIFHEVGGNWFKVFPVINNKSKFYLVVTHVNFKVKRAGGDSWEDKTTSGDYCETKPYFYILDNSGSSTGDLDNSQGQFVQGSYTTYDQFDRSFVMGNLAFYVDQLEESPTENDNSRFPRSRIPNYSVRWNMLGSFYTEGGQQVGSFQKEGYFTAQGSSF